MHMETQFGMSSCLGDVLGCLKDGIVTNEINISIQLLTFLFRRAYLSIIKPIHLRKLQVG
jgi:hypothetical protein